ncbi:MAG: hypothetical protein ACLFUZ_04900 [Candidatus Micrarchaeia archaeon]
MEFEEEESFTANSELRYITLELMRLAEKRNIPFEQMAEEYIQNTFRLKKLIEERDLPEKAFKNKTGIGYP